MRVQHLRPREKKRLQKELGMFCALFGWNVILGNSIRRKGFLSGRILWFLLHLFMLKISKIYVQFCILPEYKINFHHGLMTCRPYYWRWKDTQKYLPDSSFRSLFLLPPLRILREASKISWNFISWKNIHCIADFSKFKLYCYKFHLLNNFGMWNSKNNNIILLACLHFGLHGWLSSTFCKLLFNSSILNGLHWSDLPYSIDEDHP